MIKHTDRNNRPQDRQDHSSARRAAEERWWRDEVGIMVEHEVWHLPRLAEEQLEA